MKILFRTCETIGRLQTLKIGSNFYKYEEGVVYQLIWSGCNERIERPSCLYFKEHSELWCFADRVSQYNFLANDQLNAQILVL